MEDSLKIKLQTRNAGLEERKKVLIGIKSAPIYNSKKRIVLEDFYFEWKGILYFIPKGFIYDGASVPRPFWFLYSPYADNDTGAGLHDFGYYIGEWSQRECDYMFLYAMRHKELFFVQRGLGFGGVRIGGRFAFKKHRKDDKKKEKALYIEKWRQKVDIINKISGGVQRYKFT